MNVIFSYYIIFLYKLEIYIIKKNYKKRTIFLYLPVIYITPFKINWPTPELKVKTC